jgi:hypothetical protein
MKFPSTRTCAYAILEAIHLDGDKTRGQIMRLLTPRFARSTTEDKIAELLVNGQLIQHGDALALSLAVRRHFDQCEIDAQPDEPVITSTAGPREARPFTPLKVKKIDRNGMRPGSEDFRSWPSRHLPE